jgi:hypothetical protein
MAQVVSYLPSTCEALSSNSGTTKKTDNETPQKELEYTQRINFPKYAF